MQSDLEVTTACINRQREKVTPLSPSKLYQYEITFLFVNHLEEEIDRDLFLWSHIKIPKVIS